jgi:glycosyltransferase involved in cell wall biosynthesis
MKRAIHQLVAGFASGDAISNEAQVLRGIFREWGHSSDIFCAGNGVHPEMRHETRDMRTLAGAVQPEDIVILHLSIGCDANELFPALPGRKVVLYHNVTPAHFFQTFNTQTATLLEKGRRQTAHLAGCAELNMADSRFNADELEAAGYRDVKVLPLLIEFKHLKNDVDRRVVRACRDGRTNILFVGRGAPNKKIEDVIRAFHCYHTCVNPASRLIHVGSYNGTERYYYLLRAMVRDLKLDGDVVFTKSALQPQLNAYYSAADLFLCMSEHEGFCIPILESMHHDVPVMAYAAAALPETMDGAGILFYEKQYDAIAEMMGRMTKDRALRQAVIEGQRQRLQRYHHRDLAAELRRLLGPMLA